MIRWLHVYFPSFKKTTLSKQGHLHNRRTFITAFSEKKQRRNHPGRKPLLDHLPVGEIIFFIFRKIKISTEKICAKLCNFSQSNFRKKFYFYLDSHQRISRGGIGSLYLLNTLLDMLFWNNHCEETSYRASGVKCPANEQAQALSLGKRTVPEETTVVSSSVRHLWHPLAAIPKT